MIPQKEYQQRRNILMQKMGENSIAIICTKPEYPRTQDCPYRFRPDNNFYYLSGFSEPEAIIVLIPKRKEGEFLLFSREKKIEQEIWNGAIIGQDNAIKEFNADQAYPIDDLDLIIPDLLKNKSRLFYQFGFENGIDDDIIDWQNTLRKQLRLGTSIANTIVDITSLINEMRLIKSSAEIDILRIAAKINTEAHKRAMTHCVEGMTERQLFSELNYVYGQHNCLDLAYDPIVAAGKNACTLHYLASKAKLKKGELVLLDVGEEYQYYASDVTRTLPVSGKFNPEQKAIYELILEVQLTVIDMIKPGICFDELQHMTIRMITEGLVKLGLLQGNIEQLIAQKAYFDFYMHRVSHWIGLDVHDVGRYKVDGEWRDLQAGMVLTVEPGIYIHPNNHNVDAKWRGIGIRIEDDILVTETGHENLTAGIPKTVADVEALMAN